MLAPMMSTTRPTGWIRRRACRFAVAVVMAVCVVSCSGRDNFIRSPADGAPSVLTYPGDGQVGNAALLAGVLIVTGNCIAVRTKTGDVVTPVFPAKAVRAPSAGSSSFVWNGTEHQIGSSIELTGGLTSDNPSPVASCSGPFFSVRQD